MSFKLPTGLVSHRAKVQQLYKKVLRDIQSWNYDRIEYRYKAVLMRHRFDQNKDVKDMRIAKKLLIEGEDEYYDNRNPQPIAFPYSVGGTAHDREHTSYDQILDLWHPIEKARYPIYFARREQRKKEYMEKFYAKYGRGVSNQEADH